jgi:acyl dehydratase
MKAELFYDDLRVGDEFPPLEKGRVTETQLVRYAGASGDFNPLHTVHAVGDAAGFGGVIAHGMLVMGFVGQAIAGWVPNRYIRRMSVRFKGVTRPGEAITVTGRVIEKLQPGSLIRCSLEARGREGETKIEGGFEAAGLPRR